MDQPPDAAPGFVGIDLSKDRLDVHLRPSGRAFAVPRDGAGLERLATELRALAPALVVLEATGGFEVTVRRRGAGRRRSAAGGGQPAPDPRLRPRGGAAGQDRAFGVRNQWS